MARSEDSRRLGRRHAPHLSLPLEWRRAVRDSALSSSAKNVAQTLTTWMDSRGKCWPGYETIAAGCSFSRRTVIGAMREIEAAGFLTINRTKGRRSNVYQAVLPTVNPLHDWEVDDEQDHDYPTVQLMPPTVQTTVRNGARRAPEGGVEAQDEVGAADAHGRNVYMKAERFVTSAGWQWKRDDLTDELAAQGLDARDVERLLEMAAGRATRGTS
jgi:hypothetical protein